MLLTPIIAKRVMCLCNAIDAAAVWADLNEKSLPPRGRWHAERDGRSLRDLGFGLALL